MEIDNENRELARQRFQNDIKKKIKAVYELTLSNIERNNQVNLPMKPVETKVVLEIPDPVPLVEESKAEIPANSMFDEQDVGKLIAIIKLKVKKEYPNLLIKAAKALKYQVDISRLPEIANSQDEFIRFVKDISD